MSVRRFTSFADAVLHVSARLSRVPCGPQEDYCDVDRPCARHGSVHDVALCLWRRQHKLYSEEVR
jgi:hypothetical protein